MTSYLSYKRHMACLDADEDIIGWFTTKNGVHVPIRKGQTKETATKEFFSKKVVNAPVFKSPESMVDYGSTPEGKAYIDKIIGMGGRMLGGQAAEKLDAEYQQKRKDFASGLIKKHVENPFDSSKYYMMERDYDRNGISDIYSVSGVSHEGYHLQPVQSSNKRDVQYSRYIGNKDDKYVELTKEQAMNKFAEMFPDETFGGISHKEEEALKRYSYMTPENSKLRKGEVTENAGVIMGVIDRTYMKPKTVYRGVRGSGDNNDWANTLKNLKVGDIYSDPGFMSTSLEKDVGASEKFRGDNGYLLKIKTAAGYGKGIRLGYGLSNNPEEQEVVLQAGSQFKVLRVDHKKREIDLEQL